MVDGGELDDLQTTDRIARLVWHLACGGTVTTAAVARMNGITANGAWRSLMKISRTIPVTDEDGRWWIPEEFLPGRRR